jgi:hypothetical protein
VKLMTKEIERNLLPLAATEKVPLSEKRVVAKFFTPDADWTWFVFEGEQADDGDWYFFGAVANRYHAELGYFRLSDLQKGRGPLGLPVERDRYYRQTQWEKDWRQFVY